MAEKISVEIGLEGGAEVQKQLEDVGKSGQQAFADIKDAADQLDLSNVADGFQQVGETGVQAFDKVKTAAQNAAVFEQIIVGVKKVEGAFESLGNAATRVGARMTKSLGAVGVIARAFGPLGIAIGALGGAFVKFGDDAADALNKLNVEGAKLGQTPQQLDQLQKALGRVGIAADAIGPGLQKFRESLGADFTGNVTTALQQFIAQLERMPDGVQRTQLAIQTLGDALGGQVIAGLQAGTLNAQNFATALAGITPATQQQIADAARYQAALNQLSAAWTELKAAFTPITTPVLQFLADELRNLTIDIRNIRLEWELAKAIFATFTASGPEQQRQAAEAAAAAYRNLGTAAQQSGQQVAESGQTAFQAWQQGALAVGPFGQSLSLVATQANAAGQANAQAAQQSGQAWQQAGQQATQAGQQTVQAGQQGAQGAQTWGQAIVQAAQTAEQAISSFVSTLASVTWDAISSTGVAAWNAITSAISSAIERLRQFLGLQSQSGAGGDGAPGKARGGLIGGRGSGTSDSNLAWLSRGEYVIRAAAVRRFGATFFNALNAGHLPRYQAGGIVGGGGTSTVTLPVSQIADAIRQNSEAINSQSQVIAQLAQKIDQIAQGMVSLAEGMVQIVETVREMSANTIQAVQNLSQNTLQAIGALASAIQQQAAQEKEQPKKKRRRSEDGGPDYEIVIPERFIPQRPFKNLEERELRRRIFGFAAGGRISGRGTGTSDSILAWLSRGEHVMPARAVAQPGVLAFLEALRRSGGNLRGVLDGMGRFALGGLVPRPAFATGGAVGGMSNVTIQFPGLSPITGLRASGEVVDELRKAAALAQVRSGGRKPSRYS